MEFKLKKFKQVINVSRIANIHYFEFTNKYRTFKDNHAFYELVYVDSGSIRVEAEGYDGLLEKNQLIIHKPNEIHSLSCPDGDAPCVIIIGFECNCPEINVFSDTVSTLSSTLQKLLTEIVKEGRNVFLPPYDIPNLTDMKKRRDYAFGADQMIKLKMETFLIELVRDRNSGLSASSHSICDIGKINEIYNYINENFRETIRLDRLCFLFGTNKTSLNFAFKNLYGDTVINYTNKLRIHEAKRLLREDTFNLTQVSTMCGFSSLHYFSRMFKKSEGINPSQYTKMIKSHLE